MHIRLLGPVELVTRARAVAVGPPQRRHVFAVLAAAAGRTVPTDVLIDRVWADAPDGARRTLHVHVAQIRRLLTAEGSRDEPAQLVHRSGGYLLDIPPRQVDVHHFQDLAVAAAAPGRPDSERVTLLREALDLWRGTPLAGVPGDWAHRTRQAWHQHRIDAAIMWVNAELRCGDPARTVGPLIELAGEYPLVEPLAALLMRALHATGRTADAFATYADVRRRLADELGADPGDELRGAHELLLRQRPSLPPTPVVTAPPASSSPAFASPPTSSPAWNLPRDLADFTGRDDALRLLWQVVHADTAATAASVIVAINGMPGVGKTTLATHFAHLVADRYPDVQLHVDLLAHGTQAPLDPAAAFDALFHQLGVPSDRIPERVDDCIVLWRQELAGRRTLLLLDNAADTEQVAVMLPTWSGCLTVITSRRRLTGLDGATTLALDVLSTAEAVALQQRIVGDRVSRAPQAAREVADRCGHLPLAIRLASARLAHRPGWSVLDLAERLRATHSPLRELALQGRTVQAAFALSYEHLDPPARRMFRRLGLHPGPDFGAPAAALLVGLDLPDAEDLLAELVDVHLVEEPSPYRYRLHDLLREYAGDLVGADAENDRSAAISRLIRGYLELAVAAAQVLNYQIGLPADVTVDASPLGAHAPADPPAALAWLAAERRNLLAAIQLSADEGLYQETWRLAHVTWRYLCNEGHDEAVMHAYALAIEAADRAGEPQGVALSHNNVAYIHHRRGRWQQALHHLEQAVAIHGQVGNWMRQVVTIVNTASVMQERGRYQDALELHQTALDVLQRHPELGEEGRILLLNPLGVLYLDIGDYAAAEELFNEHLALAEKLDSDLHRNMICAEFAELRLRQGRFAEARDLAAECLRNGVFTMIEPRMRAKLTIWTGSAHRGLGDLPEALRCHREAVFLTERSGALAGEYDAHTQLATTLHAHGDDDGARDEHRQALKVARRLGLDHRIAEATDAIAALDDFEAHR